MSKQFIKDLSNQEQISSEFLVVDKQVLKDKKGRNYLNMSLSDKSGSLNARMWEKIDDVANKFDSGDFVQVKGHVQIYQNKKQIVIHDIKRVGAETVAIEDFVSSSANPPAETFEQILKIVSSIKNKKIKDILYHTLENENYKPNLLKSAAARSIHHAYVGGLLDHILSISKLMVLIGNHYPILDLDLLIFGAIYHDIGKIRELNLDNGIQYSTEGRLVGHMGIGLEMLDETFRALSIDDLELKSILKHIILSHHGRLEYGSPKRPKFLEAIVVSMIDELDSRINSVENFMKSEIDSHQSWSSFNNQYDRYFYLDILRSKLSE